MQAREVHKFLESPSTQLLKEFWAFFAPGRSITPIVHPQVGTTELPSPGSTAADARPPYVSASPERGPGMPSPLNTPFSGQESFEGRTPQT